VSKTPGAGLGQLFDRFRGANNEGILFLVLAALVITIGVLNPVFFSVSTLFSILRGAIVPMVLALAVLIIMISGGIDVSFVAIAIFAGYTSVVIAQSGGSDPGLFVVIAISIFFGLALGAFNGFVISLFRLPTLIVSLGTQSLFKGILLAYVGSEYIANLPPSMDEVATTNIVSIPQEQGVANLHVLVLPVILMRGHRSA
jgi:Ribose/xylose/arabinose/galactoside ABC-type transport systems, permease components